MTTRSTYSQIRSFNLLKLSVFCCFFFFCPGLSGQNYPFREYTVLDGLPQSQPYSIKIDSSGFTWIATRNGLSRFDGIEFRNYFKINGLPSNSINEVVLDRKGIVRALSKEGLSKYNGYGFEYQGLPPELKDWTFSPGYTVDSANNIFLIGRQPDDKSSNLICFHEGAYFDYSGRYTALDSMNVVAALWGEECYGMYLIDSYKRVWLWKNEALSLLSKRKNNDAIIICGRIYSYSGNSIEMYVYGRAEPYKMKKRKGIAQINIKDYPFSEVMEFFDGKNDNELVIPFNRTGFTLDNEGVLWFSSEKNLFRLLSTAFRKFSEEDIGIRSIWAMAEDRKGHIWFGSLYGTLTEYDGKTFIQRTEYKQFFRGDLGFYKGSRRMADGDLWFSTNRGVLIWDGSSFSRLKGIPENTQICYIYEDPVDKSKMLGTEKGLFHLKEGKTYCYSEFVDDSLGVIEGVTRYKSGKYLLSGHNGLVTFDGIHSIPVRQNILPGSYTYIVETDSYGGIWVSSEEGLYYCPDDSDSFTYGLPKEINVSANSIRVIDSTLLLVGRISDVCLINLRKFYEGSTDYYTIFDKTDGYTAADCIDNGIIKAEDGKIWILTSTGVEIFEPAKVRTNKYPPKLHLSGFDYETEKQSWEPLDKSQFFYGEPDNLRLNRNQNTIRISFAGLSTTNPEKVRYRFRLVGFEDKWSLPTPNRSVEFDKLAPGRYTFQVISSNANGVENPEPLVINFRVYPAYWQTTIFGISAIALAVILTVIATFLTMRRYQNKREEKERLRSELSRLQMSSVIKQFDPHFTFNVISSVGALIMKGEKEAAYDYILKLSSLLRTVLNDGSVIIKSLSDELDFVKRYCELQKLRFKGRFSYTIDIKGNVDLQRAIPKMTIQTFVENALKHGLENIKEGGLVKVEVRNSTSGIEIIVKDNGIGQNAARSMKTDGTGVGLKIITGIFTAMNEVNIEKSEIIITDLAAANLNLSGTEVKVIIPDSYRFDLVNRSVIKN